MMCIRYLTRFMLLLCLLCAGMDARAQLTGRYCLSYVFGWECITFLDNTHFTYSIASCTEAAEGSGVYSIIGGKLVLSFKQGSDDEPIVQEIDSTATGADSIQLQLQVANEYGEEMPGVIITFGKNSKDGRITDINGTAMITRSSTDGRFKLYMSGYGGTPFAVHLAGNNNYKIRVMLKGDFFAHIIATGTTKRYTIRNIKQNSIELKPDHRHAIFEVYERGRP